MGDVLIENATLGDIDAIHRLEKACFPAPWRREFFKNEIGASGRLNLVVKRQGAVIAYLFAVWFLDEMHVNKIAVTESERRRGVALRLMEECESVALANGVNTISLEVRQSNQGAQRFYERLQFAPLYVRPRYYPDGEGAVIMVKELPRE